MLSSGCGVDGRLQRPSKHLTEHRLGVSRGEQFSGHLGSWGVMVLGHREAWPRANSWDEVAESRPMACAIDTTAPCIHRLLGHGPIAWLAVRPSGFADSRVGVWCRTMPNVAFGGIH